MDRAVASTVPVTASNFRDGLGERRRAVQASGESIELLCLSRQLTAVPSFEFALRERASRLAGFRHESFARVRGIDRLSDPSAALAVVSDSTRGVRLSHLLTPNERRPIAIDINAAQRLIRQIVEAVAALHESGRDFAHGAIAPERIIVTANARIVIVEHVLGAALEQLRYPAERYWKELRVALPEPPAPAAGARFGHRADVMQIGAVALSLVLGRRLRDDEGPARFAELLASATAILPRGAHQPLPARLRDWIASALQVDPRRPFASAAEARAALEHAIVTMADGDGAGDGAPRIAPPLPGAAPAVLRPAAVVSAPAAAATPRRPEPPVTAPGHSPDRLPRDAGPALEPKLPARPPMRSPIASGEQPAPKAVSAPQVRALPSTERTADLPGPATAFEFADIPSPADASAPRASTLFGGDDADERSRSGTKRWMLPGVAGGLIAGLAAAGLYVAQRSPAPAPGAGLGTLNLTSNPPGAQVFVDRQSKGQTTPVELMLRPGPHNIELRGIGEPRTIDVNVVAGSQTSQAVDLARTASAVERALSRTEPAGGQRSADASTRAQMPPAGAGQAPGVGAAGTADAPPAAAPVSGWVSVTAPVEVEVREHGSVLGTSHSDRIMVSAGRHQLEIVSEALGYRATAVVQVPAGKVAPVRIEWPKGTASVNAEPWAEVWIDGEKTGETPIGNLSLPIGPHEIVFRHPELGEQRYAVSISLKAPARVSVDMRKQP